MIAVVLGVASALAYGLSDFLGGLVSRRTTPWVPAVAGCTTAAVLATALAWGTSGDPHGADLAWGVLAGVGSGLGAGFLYRGFAAGRMGVVGPVSSVGAALVPLAAGLVGGERPDLLAWLGIAVAIPGIWLVSREPASDDQAQSGAVTAAGLVDGVLAGLGFGILFAALGQVPDRAGWWPLAIAQAVSVPAVVLLALLLRETWLPRTRAALPAVWCGVLSVAATLAFTMAVQRGALTVSGVLASLYPAFTILLAATFLREHVHRTQALGLLLCGFCVVCVALA